MTIARWTSSISFPRTFVLQWCPRACSGADKSVDSPWSISGSMRDRSRPICVGEAHIADGFFRALGVMSRRLSLGRVDMKASDCMLVFQKPELGDPGEEHRGPMCEKACGLRHGGTGAIG